jgi:hypothetical protein
MQTNPFDHKALTAQAIRQRKHAWDLSKDISWDKGIDLSKYFLPLDSDAIFFPGASTEQKLALSQFLGLLINYATGQMESTMKKLQSTAWERVLRNYPVNPQMWELGELFFDEELKHSVAFFRYVDIFCQQNNIESAEFVTILPNAADSILIKALTASASTGGHAFWWMVTAVEEASIALFKALHAHKKTIDPLYYEVHLRHMEEESRHHNYGFMMLDIINEKTETIAQRIHLKTGLLQAQVFFTSWILGQLTKIFRVKKMAHKSPFLKIIADSLPLIRSLSARELAHKLFVSSPHISLILNTHYHKLTLASAKKLSAFSFPCPQPKKVETSAPLRETRS